MAEEIEWLNFKKSVPRITFILFSKDSGSKII